MSSDINNSISWGRLPDDVRSRLETLEWRDVRNLRQRLLGERAFPIRFPLIPPTAHQALAHIERFQQFVKTWSMWEQQEQLEWETRSYHKIGEQQIPTYFVLNSMQALLAFLGESAIQRSLHWELLLYPLLNFKKSLYTAFVHHLSLFERLSLQGMNDLIDCVKQLHEGMGNGLYLREIPLKNVDTKFLEINETLLSIILDAVWDNSISTSGSLNHWLGVKPNPNNWILLRPLCANTRNALGGLELFQMPLDNLMNTPMPCNRIIVVENNESGFALPEIPNAVAIIGRGRNTPCLAAPWMKDRQVVYWGDIDSWGFTCLAESRRRLPSLTSIMMDKNTLLEFADRMVIEKESSPMLDELTVAEQETFALVTSKALDGKNRLEQERLSSAYIREKFSQW